MYVIEPTYCTNGSSGSTIEVTITSSNVPVWCGGKFTFPPSPDNPYAR